MQVLKSRRFKRLESIQQVTLRCFASLLYQQLLVRYKIAPCVVLLELTATCALRSKLEWMGPASPVAHLDTLNFRVNASNATQLVWLVRALLIVAQHAIRVYYFLKSSARVQLIVQLVLLKQTTLKNVRHATRNAIHASKTPHNALHVWETNLAV